MTMRSAAVWTLVAAILGLLTGEALSLVPVVLNGAGSTLPVQIMIDGTPSNPSWVSQFQTLSKGLVTTNYNPSGSASGEASILSRSVDFGISSCPLNDAERLSLNGTPRLQQSTQVYLLTLFTASIIHFPIFLGALEIAYNIPAQFISGPLNLTADILSGIYQAKITRWNDPLILASNPKLNYTAVINPISRSEGAGIKAVLLID
jgi:phosphate transport system substrate-binding protein